MAEGLIAVLIMSFITLVASLLFKYNLFVTIPSALSALIVTYLLIRVRVKMSRAEKEKLRAHIEELQQKIETMSRK